MFVKSFLKSTETSEFIDKFINEQLTPTITELEKVALNVTRFKVTLWGSFSRGRLARLHQNFQEQTKNFLVLYYMYSNPDKFFAELQLKPSDTERIDSVMEGYTKSREMVMALFEEGFRLNELIDRQITTYDRSADHRMAITLSLLAVIASLFAVLAR
jgi:hypothetical protein